MSGIEDELRKMAAIAGFFGRPASLEGIVLEHGRRFEPAPLPEGVERGEPKNCFSNSMRVVLGAPDELGYVYCEGYVWRPGISLLLIHHGWVTVEGADVAIDPTLLNAEECEYWGLDFQTEFAVEVMAKHNVTGRTLDEFARQILDEQD